MSDEIPYSGGNWLDMFQIGSFAAERINSSPPNISSPSNVSPAPNNSASAARPAASEKPVHKRKKRPKLNQKQYQAVEAAEPFSGEAPNLITLEELYDCATGRAFAALHGCNCEACDEFCACISCQFERSQMHQWLAQKIAQKHRDELQETIAPWSNAQYFEDK